MSLIVWDEQSSGRFMDASEYTGFHTQLAKKIIPYLEPGDTLCDIGCGLGRLDFELAPHVAEILAVDISEYAIRTLEKNVALAGISNIHVRQGNAEELEQSFDVILMSLFGLQDTSGILKRCRRRHVRIVGAGRKSGLYPERYRRELKDAVPIVQDEFDSLGIKYSLEMCSFEFGQPLRTKHDAEQFVLTNAPEADSREIADFLNDNMQQTGRDDFPFYLPYQKELGIFVVQM